MNFEQQVIQVVAEAVGVEPDSLGRATDFEADLAVDSIRMMTLLSKLTPLLAQPEQAAAQLTPERLGQLRTLGQLIDFFQQDAAVTAPTVVAVSEAAPAAAAFAATEIPIAASQYLFLLAHFLCNSSALCSAVRVHGRFDRDAAHSAWRQLIKRHVNLQTRFSVPAGASRFAEYRYVRQADLEPPAMPVDDWRDRSATTQQQLLAQRFEDALNRSWHLQQWPLHEISLVRLAEDDFMVFLANEHLICDGLGSQQLLHEFLVLYAASLDGSAAALPPSGSVDEYTRIIETINAYASVEEAEAFSQHLAGQPKGAYFWNAPQLASMTPRYRNRRYSLDALVSAGLLECTRKLRVPMNSLLVAAGVRAVAARESRPQTVLQIPTSGTVYPDVDATHLVGCFAGNLSLAFDRPATDESWQALVGKVHAQLQHGLAWGFDRAQTRQMAAVVREHIVLNDGVVAADSLALMRRAGSKSNLYLPFTGHSPIRSTYGALSVTDTLAGGRNVPGAIDVLQELREGQLHLSVSYDADQFAAAVIDELMLGYQQALAALVNDVVGVTTGDALMAHEAGPAQGDASPHSQDQPQQVDVLDALCRIAAEVMHKSLGRDAVSADLEADLGLDSLGRIRVITRASALVTGRIDRERLFAARTLLEMAVALGHQAATPAHVQQTADGVHMASHQSAAAAHTPSPADTSAAGRQRAAAMALDPSLPEIPHLHILDQARRTPQLPAVEHGADVLTYAELDQRSNRLAQYLHRQGVRADGLVGVMTRRGPGMLTAMLGVLKAGGAYVPVDPEYPPERIRTLLGHAGVDILLTESGFAPVLKQVLQDAVKPLTLVMLDEWAMMLPGVPGVAGIVGSAQWLAEADAAPQVQIDPDDLMVVLYTSGSTGAPKGVALNHRGYFNRLRWHQRTFDLRPGERVAQKTSCCFDISVWELFWPLMVGGTVCAVEREVVRNPWQLAEWMVAQRINVMHFVPSMFGEFVRALANEPVTFPDLNWLIFSGEALPVSSVRNWVDQHGLRTGLANLYGPTEASIDVTCQLIRTRPGEQVDRISIGHPIDNTHIFILDADGRRAPVGVQGELCIAGVQLARGYLHDPQKTAEAFISNPVADVPWPVVYRTGDLASELPDGSFDYHGRLDSQVKVRGFRIELGEIEAALDAHPQVDEAAVLAISVDDDKKLVACVVGRDLQARALKEFLSRRLPEYMIPADIIELPLLPKNHNGKLDRKALLARVSSSQSAAAGALSATDAPALYPLGPAQRWLMQYFGPPYRWVGFNCFTYKQPLHVAAFREALADIVQRHPALRTVFVEHDGQWLQQVEPAGRPPGAELFDGSHLTPDEREAAVRQEIVQTCTQFVIDRAPLWRLLVVKSAAERFEIVMMGHHLIGDLVSNNLLFAQLWRRYAEILAGQAAPLSPVPAYTDLVQHLSALEARGALDSHVQYWRERFPDPGCALRLPMDFPEGQHTAEAMQVLNATLDATESRALMADARERYDSSLYTLLLAPLYRALAERTGQQQVILSQRMSGRDIGDARLNFFDSVGDFAINYPLGVQVDAADWDTLVKRIKTAFAAVPMNGATFDWLSAHWPQWMYPDDRLTPVRVNYLGNVTALPDDLFETHDEQRDQRLELPGQRLSVPIEIHLWTAQRRVHVSCTYSAAQYRAQTVQALLDAYLDGLRQLIATTAEVCA